MANGMGNMGHPCFAKRFRRTRWEWCAWRSQAM